jgi:hypothetical protein
MKAEGFYKQRKVNTKELPPRLHAWYRTKMGFSLVVDLHTKNGTAKLTQDKASLAEQGEPTEACCGM